MKIILTIVIAIMQTLIVIIPLKGKLSDNRSKFPKNFTRLGWFLISCCVVTTFCTILFFFLTDKEEEKSKQTLSTQLQQRDSIHQQRIIEAGKSYTSALDSNNKNTIEALAKYGLKYDTAQKRIEKLLKDSSTRITNIINGEDPSFNICDIKLLKSVLDTLVFKIFFCSENATAYKINVTVDMLAKNKATNQYLPFFKATKMFPSTAIINKGKFISIGDTIKKFPLLDIYLFRIKGTYEKFDGKIIPIDIIHAYDIPEKHFGLPNASVEAETRKVISQLQW